MWASDNEGKGSENALGVKEVGELLLRNVLKFKNKIKKEMYSEDNVDGIWPMARFGGYSEEGVCVFRLRKEHTHQVQKIPRDAEDIG